MLMTRNQDGPAIAFKYAQTVKELPPWDWLPGEKPVMKGIQQAHTPVGPAPGTEAVKQYSRSPDTRAAEVIDFVPTLPVNLNIPPRPPTPPAAAISRLADFLHAGGSEAGGVTVLTGAGVSVDSGVRAYRGSDGRYMNPNYKPILYQELVDPTPSGRLFRQRYWLRSFLGFPPVRSTQPNPTHYAIAALQHSRAIRRLITQNVDGLHLKALRGVWPEQPIQDSVLELHGSLFSVHCNQGHRHTRDTFQELLAAANPSWAAFAAECERTGQTPRTNPDGDVSLEGANYASFVVPTCPDCALEGRTNDVHKPDVIFFGESIPGAVRDRSFAYVTDCSRLLVIGTTLSTYSAFRLIKHALELNKPVLLLNVGPTRADPLIGTVGGIEKLEIPAGAIIRDAVRTVLGSVADTNPAIAKLLASGVVRAPPGDPSNDGPRAAG